MAEFSKKDREFLIKAMKQFDKLEKRVKVLEDAKGPAEKKLPAAVLSDGFNFEETNDDIFYEDSDLRAISLAFKEPTTPQNQRSREILAQTIFKAIQDMCQAYGVASLAVTIDSV